MTDNMRGPVTPSAAAHAERIRARAEERVAAAEKRDGRQTAEIYGERAAAGFRADEALRERARRNELRARGQWVPGDEETDEVEDVDEEEPVDVEEEDESTSTAERYAARERKRQAAERQANVRAQTGAIQTMGRELAPQRPPAAAQPHRYAHAWEQPAP